MTILYVFPHPDDESFGPARGMSKQLRQGHTVHLLVLTKGGATRVRHSLGLTVEQMGELRHSEMLEMKKALGLSGMHVLDLPDGGLKDLDPREIEKVVAGEIECVRPDVVVTYAVHGNSGFHDHLVAHAVVKRAALDTRDRIGFPRRIAFFTITAEEASMSDHFRLTGSRAEDIGCLVPIDLVDIERNQAALDCYRTYREIIDASGVRKMLGGAVAYEIFGELRSAMIDDLCAGL